MTDEIRTTLCHDGNPCASHDLCCGRPAEQQFIASWSGKNEPPPRAVVPGAHFRIKGGVLQQLCSHPSGGRVRWWINVPEVEERESDVIPS